MGKMVFIVDMINGFCKEGALANPKNMDMVPLMHDFLENYEGEKVEVRIGEDEEDPIFTITDLLPHLAREQMQKKFRKDFIHMLPNPIGLMKQ